MERKNPKPIALFIGRFQPFHLGHLKALKWIAEQSSRVIVAIGSAQKGFEPENPFTADERKKMIWEQIEAADLAGKCRLAAVTDVDDNEMWVAHVDANMPPYDVVYSNNGLVRLLMKRAGKEVRDIPFFRRKMYDATKIRGRMREGKRWQDRVPEKVLEAMERMHAEERIRKL